MSEEKVPEVQGDLENVESETETPLKTPKKKFVMTPARLENLKKGREKRAENVRKKKEIEAQVKEEEKSKKAEIKKRVEAELLAQQSVPVEEEVDSSESESEKEISPPPPKPRKSVGREVKPQARRVSQGRVNESQRVNSSPQHVVVFI